VQAGPGYGSRPGLPGLVVGRTPVRAPPVAPLARHKRTLRYNRYLMRLPASSRLQSQFAGNAVLLVAVIAILFAADTFLVKASQAESKADAVRSFAQGKSLFARGDYSAALDSIQNALSLERDNRDYSRTFAEVQLAAGKVPDAEATLTDLLQNDSDDGLSSLIMARALAKQGRYADAVSYYHRAIYGHWDQDPAGNRRKARFELIDYLAGHDARQDLLAELLAIEDQATAGHDTSLHIARLFLAAGSPTRAADLFRAILRDNPADVDALVGLGEAEFANGDYRAAQREFSTALHLDPDNREATQRQGLCDEVLALDPSLRGLGAAERFERSRKLVELTWNAASQCFNSTPPNLPQQDLLDRGGKALKERVRISTESEQTETNLDLAEQLWQARRTGCKPGASPNDPLSLVLARLAQ
jgi:tetratricopeptide (TPR) repeat protein